MRNFTIRRAPENYIKPSQLKVGQLALVHATESSSHAGCLMLGTQLGPVNISHPEAAEPINDVLLLLTLLNSNDVFLISGRETV